jgi:hypothetical protein
MKLQEDKAAINSAIKRGDTKAAEAAAEDAELMVTIRDQVTPSSPAQQHVLYLYTEI